MKQKIRMMVLMGIMTGILFACASNSENDRRRQEKTASDSGISGQAAVSGNATGKMSSGAEGTASGGVAVLQTQMQERRSTGSAMIAICIIRVQIENP